MDGLTRSKSNEPLGYTVQALRQILPKTQKRRIPGVSVLPYTALDKESVMSNNHPSRNAASAELKRHHEQYERLEQIAGILNGCNQHEFAHAVRSAIFDLKLLRKELKNATK